MPGLKSLLLLVATAAIVLLTASPCGVQALNKDVIPSQFSRTQQENLQRFLDQHEKPDRYVPAQARFVSEQPASMDVNAVAAPGKPIKQYMVQILSHRPVPGQEEIKQVDVYYYRPNPEAGKPGITVRHTVDLATGNQVGATEVLLNHHTPMSREEVAQAVSLAREKAAPVSELYKDRNPNTVHWEYLQLMINQKYEQYEPGDRVVRLVFVASTPKGQARPAPVRVVVNLTRGTVDSPEDRGPKIEEQGSKEGK
jgi:hypothetical protein